MWRLARGLSAVGMAVVLALMASPAAAQSQSLAFADFDRGMALLNEELPGFGGLFYEDGVLHVYMVGGDKTGVADLFEEEVEVLRGRYEFAQLKRWKDRMIDLVAEPGVVFLDLDEKNNRLLIGLDNSRPRLGMRRSLKAMAGRLGVPREAIAFEAVEPIVPAVHTLSSAFNPVPGGVEINFPGFLCTLGFNVRFAGDGPCYFFTNSHCTSVQGGVESTPYLQPAGGMMIGTEIYDPTYFSGPPCPAGRVCRYSDSAAALYSNPAFCEFGAIARTLNPGSVVINHNLPRWKIVSKLGSPTVGQFMAKTGRTTGWSEGNVTNTCATTNVFGGNITLLCQSFVAASVGSGDSGSPVFRRRLDSSLAQLAGLLWGSSGSSLFVFSPMDNIEFEVGGTLPVF